MKITIDLDRIIERVRARRLARDLWLTSKGVLLFRRRPRQIADLHRRPTADHPAPPRRGA